MSNLPIVKNFEHSNILIEKITWHKVSATKENIINKKFNIESNIFCLYSSNSIENFYKVVLLSNKKNLFLKIIDINKLPNIEFSNDIAKYLYKNKINTSLIKKKIIDKNNKLVFVLYDFIEGNYLKINNRNLFNLGKYIANFHKVLQNYKFKKLIKKNSFKKIKQFNQILNKNNYKKLTNDRNLIKILKNPDNKKYINILEKNQQIIHGDLNFKNILVNKKNKIFILDFEDMEYSFHNPLFDLSTIIERFILIRSNKNKFQLINSLFKGYFGKKYKIEKLKIEIFYLIKSFSLKSILTLMNNSKKNKVYYSEMKKFIEFYNSADKFLLLQEK